MSRQSSHVRIFILGTSALGLLYAFCVGTGSPRQENLVKSKATSPAPATQQTTFSSFSPNPIPLAKQPEALNSMVRRRGRTPLLTEPMVQKLEEGSALNSACDSLSRIDRDQNEPIIPENARARFEDSMLGRSADPTFESVKPLVRYIMHTPALKSIIGLKDDSNPSVAPSQLVLDKYQALTAHRARIESILNQSYLLLMIGRSVGLKPELASNAEVTKYCRDIEAKINSSNKPNLVAQKKEFLEFLAAASIEPEDIDYDPDYQADLEVEIGDNYYTYNLGWARKLLASN